jgi:hypothetical protein
MSLMRMLMRAAAAVPVVLVAVAGAAGYPRPAPVPPRWELEFAPGDLRLYVDPAENQSYWYFDYQVANRTGREQVWAPSFTLFTDCGEIIASGRGVPSRVVDDLKKLLGNPLLETQNEIIGEIFHGRENAKDGLVVWRADTLDVNELSMFIGGLSGETATVTNPATGKEVLLRKTLERDYLVPGDVLPRGSKPIDLVEQQWVMR